MCSLESLLCGHAQIDRVASFGNSLPIEFGVGEYFRRFWEQVTACGHGYRGRALTTKWLILLASDDQDAPGISWCLGHQNVGADIFSRCDDVFPLPPNLSKLLLKVYLVVNTEEGVGSG